MTENPDYFNQTHGGAVNYTTTAAYQQQVATIPGYYVDPQFGLSAVGAGATASSIPSDKAAADAAKTASQVPPSQTPSNQIGTNPDGSRIYKTTEAAQAWSGPNERPEQFTSSYARPAITSPTSGIPSGGNVYIDGKAVYSNTPSWSDIDVRTGEHTGQYSYRGTGPISTTGHTASGQMFNPEPSGGIQVEPKRDVQFKMFEEYSPITEVRMAQKAIDLSHGYVGDKKPLVEGYFTGTGEQLGTRYTDLRGGEVKTEGYGNYEYGLQPVYVGTSKEGNREYQMQNKFYRAATPAPTTGEVVAVVQLPSGETQTTYRTATGELKTTTGKLPDTVMLPEQFQTEGLLSGLVKTYDPNTGQVVGVIGGKAFTSSRAERAAFYQTHPETSDVSGFALAAGKQNEVQISGVKPWQTGAKVPIRDAGFKDERRNEFIADYKYQLATGKVSQEQYRAELTAYEASGLYTKESLDTVRAQITSNEAKLVEGEKNLIAYLSASRFTDTLNEQMVRKEWMDQPEFQKHTPKGKVYYGDYTEGELLAIAQFNQREGERIRNLGKTALPQIRQYQGEDAAAKYEKELISYDKQLDKGAKDLAVYETALQNKPPESEASKLTRQIYGDSTSDARYATEAALGFGESLIYNPTKTAFALSWGMPIAGAQAAWKMTEAKTTDELTARAWEPLGAVVKASPPVYAWEHQGETAQLALMTGLIIAPYVAPAIASFIGGAASGLPFAAQTARVASVAGSAFRPLAATLTQPAGLFAATYAGKAAYELGSMEGPVRQTFRFGLGPEEGGKFIPAQFGTEVGLLGGFSIVQSYSQPTMLSEKELAVGTTRTTASKATLDATPERAIGIETVNQQRIIGYRSTPTGATPITTPQGFSADVVALDVTKGAAEELGVEGIGSKEVVTRGLTWKGESVQLLGEEGRFHPLGTAVQKAEPVVNWGGAQRGLDYGPVTSTGLDYGPATARVTNMYIKSTGEIVPATSFKGPPTFAGDVSMRQLYLDNQIPEVSWGKVETLSESGVSASRIKYPSGSYTGASPPANVVTLSTQDSFSIERGIQVGINKGPGTLGPREVSALELNLNRGTNIGTFGEDVGMGSPERWVIDRTNLKVIDYKSGDVQATASLLKRGGSPVELNYYTYARTEPISDSIPSMFGKTSQLPTQFVITESGIPTANVRVTGGSQSVSTISTSPAITTSSAPIESVSKGGTISLTETKTVNMELSRTSTILNLKTVPLADSGVISTTSFAATKTAMAPLSLLSVTKPAELTATRQAELTVMRPREATVTRQAELTVMRPIELVTPRPIPITSTREAEATAIREATAMRPIEVTVMREAVLERQAQLEGLRPIEATAIREAVLERQAQLEGLKTTELQPLRLVDQLKVPTLDLIRPIEPPPPFVPLPSFGSGGGPSGGIGGLGGRSGEWGSFAAKSQYADLLSVMQSELEYGSATSESLIKNPEAWVQSSNLFGKVMTAEQRKYGPSRNPFVPEGPGMSLLPLSIKGGAFRKGVVRGW